MLKLFSNLAAAQLLQFNFDQIIQIAIFLAILVVAWTILRAVLRLTMRIFQFGCLAILLFGVILMILRELGGV